MANFLLPVLIFFISLQRCYTANPDYFQLSSFLRQQAEITTKNGISRMEWFTDKGPMMWVIEKYGINCSLTIFFEETATPEAHVLRKAMAGRPVRIFLLSSEILLQEKPWTQSTCDFNIFLLSDGQKLIQHSSINHIQAAPYKPHYYPPPLWNFKAYFLIFLLTRNDANQMALNIATRYNFKKTENLLVFIPRGNHVLAVTHSLYTDGTKMTLLDSWRNGRFSNSNHLFPSKLKDLKGSVLKVATFPHPPSVVFDLNDEGHIRRRLGVDMEVIHSLSRVKNFTVQFVEISSIEKWGFLHPNGTWDGLMGAITQETSDIGVCNVFNEHFRWNFVDFSYPYNFMPGCFIAPSPKPVLNWQSPMLPFTRNTWISIGAVYITAALILYVVAKLSVRQEDSRFQNIVYNYFYIVDSLTVGSVRLVPSYDPTRIYMGFIWIFCFIVSSAYSANLVAFLSVNKLAPPIDTLEQLATSGLRFGAHSFWLTQFSGSSDPYVDHIFNTLETDYEIFDLFEEVEKNKFALVENKQYLEVNRDARFTYGDKATIRIVGECLIPYSISLILPKNSPLTRNLGYNLLSTFESGMMIKWQADVVKFFRKLYEEKRLLRGHDDVPIGPRALSLAQLQGVFYIFLCGLIWSFLTFILEFIFKPFKK
ncbi:hypothetical protein SK128_007172 [Halocaridina rubra]|uniref:Uncharacterized protein n=1 Tax=Halocaridina rubra TaxID=373956 RepID=A0AAN9A7M0_HALRR